MAILQIELEDTARTSWWAGVLATLTSQSGNAYLRFVGRVDGHRRYKGATFPAPRTLGALAPEEAWAPGMTKGLQDLRRDIENDGWVEIGRGTEPWAFRYERSVPRSSETKGEWAGGSTGRSAAGSTIAMPSPGDSFARGEPARGDQAAQGKRSVTTVASHRAARQDQEAAPDP